MSDYPDIDAAFADLENLERRRAAIHALTTSVSPRNRTEPDPEASAAADNARADLGIKER